MRLTRWGGCWAVKDGPEIVEVYDTRNEARRGLLIAEIDKKRKWECLADVEEKEKWRKLTSNRRYCR
jgi:hypothetical protein